MVRPIRASSPLLLALLLACPGSPRPDAGDDGGGFSFGDGGGHGDGDGEMDSGAALADGGSGVEDAGDAGFDGGAVIDDNDAGDEGPADGGSLTDAGDGDGGLECVLPVDADRSGTAVLVDPLGTATVSLDDPLSCQRTYTLSTTAALRDGLPSNPRTVSEAAGWPTLRSGHDLLDALYALALDEVRENSVDSITDYAFNHGQPVDCGTGGCFETGRLWEYVWTRDASYSVDLGLAALSPIRSGNSLRFKLSELREGGGLEVVQDTGSGGSYPVSTDRVVWALGARALLAELEGEERAAFAALALTALKNTTARDRLVAFDPEDGLYRGESSFLDWREQTYAEWTADDVVHIAMSKSLSTNALHFAALSLLADLADEAGETSVRDDARAQATALSARIRERFWIDDVGLFAAFTGSDLDPAPAVRFDLLGSALVVLLGIADADQAARVLESYPHYGPGAPVIFPQQQDVPIYHNRGEWPFVTAYWLRAAAHVGNAAVGERMMNALLRGAALNLSNMENFEAATGAPFIEEGATSGPVVSSQRQLWSVAAFVSFVHHTLFGLHPVDDGIEVAPFLPASMRSALFGGTSTLALNRVPFRGRELTVVLKLPEASGEGALVVSSIRVDGVAVGSAHIPASLLGPSARIDVELVAGTGAASGLTAVSDADYREVFGPRTPRITSVDGVGGKVQLSLERGGESASDVRFSIYRDGVRIADDLPGTTAIFVDDGSDTANGTSPCYSVSTRFISSGNHSQHAPPTCFWGAGYSHITSFDASSFANVGGSYVYNHGRFHYEGWGDAGHSLTVSGVVPAASGRYLLQVTFGNGLGPIDTGITCALKRVVVERESDGVEVARGILAMPHLGDWQRWEDSSLVPADLVAGTSYRVRIESHDDARNMSAFSHFAIYTGGQGGDGGELNRVNIAELKLLRR